MRENAVNAKNIKPKVIKNNKKLLKSLEAGYREMAEDKERRKEALEWAEAAILFAQDWIEEW